MIHKKIKLFEDKEVYLTTYIHDNFGAYGTENGCGAIIVLPGGEHGMSVANELSYRNEEEMQLSQENPNISLWVDMAANWLKSLSV